MNLAHRGRVLLLGTHSFVDGGLKVGMQYLAEGLARHGWQVDYVATASSPFDAWGRRRHGRLNRAWLQGQDRHGVVIEQGLTEYAFKAFFPAHKLLMRTRWQLASNLWLAPTWLRQRRYDLCVHETSPTVVYLPLVNRRHLVFRLSDPPAGFAHDLPRQILEEFERHLASSAYDDIWAVSTPLAEYALQANPQGRITVIANGVSEALGQPMQTAARKPNSAVFLGGLNHWIDDSLIDRTAKLLPEWRFDLYGPVSRSLHFGAPNIFVHPPVSRTQVPDLLAGYEVGLIPFRDTDDRLRFVERPLKFYEYIGAGLGVASTDIGGLRRGMGNLAAYGNSPEEFAQAIGRAKTDAALRSPSFRENFINEHGWSSVMNRFLARIEHLDHKTTSAPAPSPLAP